jgi:uncharacterized protein (TIGR00299 family) protein
MKIAYLECNSGIAGDMCLGALVDMGVPLEYLAEKLKGLGIEQEYQLRAEKVNRKGQLATKVDVDLLRGHSVEDDHHHHDEDHTAVRHLPEIERLIEDASLPPKAKDWSLQIFRQLAIAEGAVHGIEPEKVHFHEVGATDAIVDIVGTCLGLDWLNIEQIYCSCLPTGGGTVKAAHGKLPVPVPAVLKLWQMVKAPVYSNGIDQELVTPTGAAIATTLAKSFGPPPTMQIEAIGLGAGSKELPIPNILRLWLGVEVFAPILENIAVLETQIDDLNPQAFGYIFDLLFAVGAVDVFTQAIGMKKSRPGILLTVICPPEKIQPCEEVLFRETTTLGIRRLLQQRAILPREIEEVETVYGKVRVKVAKIGLTIVNVQPEYNDCAEIAQKHHLPWYQVHQMALEAFHST